MSDSSVLMWLQEWYRSHCDGDWEHEFGVYISTLDNPGWTLSVDLTRTEAENAPFDAVSIERSDDDWLRCWVAESQFKGYGDPTKLLQLLEIFRFWIQGAQAEVK